MRTALASIIVVMAVSNLAADTDPLRCWWRTSRGAVSVGEPFDATLTCAVREQDTTRTVPDETRLGAAVVQLAPFEVVSGSHPADLRSPTHRFFQYHYTLRIIDRDVIGHDARFPDLSIAFRVHTRVNGEWQSGRDRTYVIPGDSVRVLSLVPADASDIRDSDGAPFERVEALRFRARALEIGAIALAVLSLILATPAAFVLMRKRRQQTPEEPRRLPRHAIFAAVDTTLASIDRDRASGWTPDLVHRALTATRLAAAAVLGHDVASHPGRTASGDGGTLRVTRGWRRRQAFDVSGAVTASDVRSAIQTMPGDTPSVVRQALDDLADALATFTSALYGREMPPDSSSLDRALENARGAVRDTRRRR